MAWGNTGAYFGIFSSNFPGDIKYRNGSLIPSTQVGFWFFPSVFFDDTRKLQFLGIGQVTLKKRDERILLKKT